MENLLGIIFNLIDDQSRILVGTLIKRLEDLQVANPPLSQDQLKQVYLSIARNVIYENARGLKRIINAKIPTIIDFTQSQPK